MHLLEIFFKVLKVIDNFNSQLYHSPFILPLIIHIADLIDVVYDEVSIAPLSHMIIHRAYIVPPPLKLFIIHFNLIKYQLRDSLLI